LVFLFLGIYTSSVFKVYLPYIDYYANYNYISKVLCENKNKPQMHCNGKCHLKKTIEKASKEESRSKHNEFSGKFVSFLELAVKPIQLQSPWITIRSIQVPDSKPCYHSPSREITSPPPQFS
jgi:hypothetical protein